MEEPHLVLIGFMAVGKSSVGRIVASLLGLPFFDSDRVIERDLGMPVSRIFPAYGEPRFRQMECDVVERLLSGPRSVIATGGGAPLNPATARLLRDRAAVVLLTSTPAAILRRVGNASSRPLLAGPDPAGRIRELLAERDDGYRSVAHLTIDTSERAIDEVARDLAAAVRSGQIGRESHAT